MERKLPVEDGVSSDMISEAEWKKITKNSETLKLIKVENGTLAEFTAAKFYRSSTFFANCYRQPANSSNPAHLMMKLGFMYELANYYESNDKNPDNMFKYRVPIPFDNAFLHQCADPFRTGWAWGQMMWKTISRRASVTELIAKHTVISTIGYKAERQELFCFDDMYMSVRMGFWMQGESNLALFRKEVAQKVGEPREILEASYIEPTSNRLSPVFRQPFCPQEGNVTKDNKSSAKIKVFQRSATRNLRKFLNLAAVVSMIQEFTTVPVEIITANETTTLAEQIKSFNSFDVLITSHGSHLTNGMFLTNPHAKAIIEVVASKFDAVFFSNYNYAIGLADYIFSTGHATPSMQTGGSMQACPFPTFESFREKNCTFDDHIYPNTIEQTWVVCAARHQTRFCDLMVSIDTLRRDLDQVLNIGLCPENVSLSAGAEYTTRLPGYSNYKVVPPGKSTGIKWYGNRVERIEMKPMKPPPRARIPEMIPSTSDPVKDLALPGPVESTLQVQVEKTQGFMNSSSSLNLGSVNTSIPSRVMRSNYFNSSGTVTVPVVQLLASSVSLT